MIFCASFKFASGKIVSHRYDTALARALAIIGYSTWADVVRTWEE